MITAINSSRESHLKMWVAYSILTTRVSTRTKMVSPLFSVHTGMFKRLKTVTTLKNVYTGLYAAPKSGQAMMTQSETPYVFSVTFAKTPGCFNFVIKADDAEAKKIYVKC